MFNFSSLVAVCLIISFLFVFYLSSIFFNVCVYDYVLFFILSYSVVILSSGFLQNCEVVVWLISVAYNRPT